MRATSPSITGAPSTILTGMRANSATSDGLEFMRTLYSRLPMRAVPAGRITFEVFSALTTSNGESPLLDSARGSMSTLICRCLPPNGAGVDSPGIVNSRTRMKLRP